MLFGGNNKFIVFGLIPLILSIGIIPVIPTSFAVESNQICIDKVWIESTKGKIACVTPTTAEKLVERGWGTMFVEMMKEQSDELDEKSITPVISGGTLPITETPIIGSPEKEYSKNYVQELRNLEKMNFV